MKKLAPEQQGDIRAIAAAAATATRSLPTGAKSKLFKV